MKSLVQSALLSMGLESDVSPGENPSFIKGRCALVHVDEQTIGVMGEIAPATLDAFELKYPAAAFELDLERIFSSRDHSSAGRQG